MKYCTFFLVFALFAISSCNSGYTIKQTGYYKIDFPRREYRVFEKPGYPYTFEYPVYGTVIQDTSFFEDKPENPFWLNIDFPQFNGKIYISYKEVMKNDFNKLVNDAFNLTYKHSSKATEIRDSLMQTPKGVSGVYFRVGGNAATANQFFVTDSVNHFLRGALYFDATPNEDSLAIVNDFLQVDMKHLINTLQWKDRSEQEGR
ncbi:MAG: gliding motility lipoprotein GldD [Flavitalea sp.]